MELRAVLVGCGLMSRRWLEAAAKIDGTDHRGSGGPRRVAGEKPGR
jgi:hypothetical protein